MLLTHIALRAAGNGDRKLSDNELVDLLWISTATADGINHIHVRTIYDMTQVVFFVVAPDQGYSDLVSRQACERAIRNVPALGGWSIQP
jgi:hypothetical protein